MILPPLLSPGDTIAIISPSRVITESQLDEALKVFNSWGLNVMLSETLYAKDGYFAGTDSERKKEWQWAISSPEVKAIFCARGGYGLTRYVDQLDLTQLSANPKWIIGFSDVTAIHLALQPLNIASLHALMPVQFSYTGVQKSLSSLYDFLFDGTIDYKLAGTNWVEGDVTAPVIGGNLSLLAESLGTGTELQTDGKILFIEEIDEYLYKIDRMMNQLHRAGKFNGIKGLILGDFSDLKDTQIPFGKTFREVCMRYVPDNCPVAAGVPIGHENYNLALPLQVPVSLQVNKAGTRITAQIHRPQES